MGARVDNRARTTNKSGFAIGDVAGGFQFTYMAGYHDGIVIRNALFKLPAHVDHRAVPWVTYTESEPAHVGVNVPEAKDQGRDLTPLTWTFADNDRAQAERETGGLIKVLVDRKGRIHGATIVGAHAGELIHPWVVAIGAGIRIGAMARYIAPYPTLGGVSKSAVGSFHTPKLFSERTRRIVRFLQKLG